jgi:hypothetical protein
MPIQETYKDHHILISAWEVPELHQWETLVTVLCGKGPKQLFRHPIITDYFTTREEAENEGLALAKKWIDDRQTAATQLVIH